MKQHVQDTLTIINQRIARLQSLAQQIRELLDDDQLNPADSANSCPPRNQRRRVARRGRPRGVRAVHAPESPEPKAQRRSRSGGLVDTIRRVVAGRDGKFTRVSLQAVILERHPELATKIGGLSVALIDMANRGELIRTGAGRDAVYTCGKLKSTGNGLSQTEREYREFRSTIPATPSAE